MHYTQIGPGAVVEAVKDHVFCELDGETVILHTEKGKYYGLNEVGGAVWSSIQRPRRFDMGWGIFSPDLVTLQNKFRVGIVA